MNPFDLPSGIADAGIYNQTVAHLRARGIVLPRFSELAAPETIPDATRKMADAADKGAPDARNLFGVHWFNQSMELGGKTVPAYIELPRAVTGVPARIVVMLGRHFPMIHAHKVLAAYACLAPRLVTGMFDPTHHRAVWPSTGNYCRGDLPHPRLPWRRRAAGRHERGALQLAGAMGHRPLRHRAHARHGIQRQGDL